MFFVYLFLQKINIKYILFFIGNKFLLFLLSITLLFFLLSLNVLIVCIYKYLSKKLYNLKKFSKKIAIKKHCSKR